MNTAKPLRCLVLAAAFILLCSFGKLQAQCTTEVWNTTHRPANLSRFQSLVPATMQPRFAARLTQTDWLIVYKNTTKDFGPHDEGFVIARNGHILLQQPLSSVPAWKLFAKEERESDLPAFGVSAAQICSAGEHMVAIGFQACCDTSSALLFFAAVQTGQTYRVSTLPPVNGGKLEISQSTPLKLRLWNATDDGDCNACPQHFIVSSYQILNRRPVFVRRFITSKRFQVFQFDPYRIEVLPRSR